jgi:virginiamycin B lyase
MQEGPMDIKTRGQMRSWRWRLLMLFTSLVPRLVVGQTVQEFPLAESGTYPVAITVGPNAALWFTATRGSTAPGIYLGQFQIEGTMTETQVTPTGYGNALTYGSTGALWFSEHGAGKIGRINGDGTLSEINLQTTNDAAEGFAGGPDGAMWFTESPGARISRIASDGTITTFPLPAEFATSMGITNGPDGAIWFTDPTTGRIGRITTAGDVTSYPVGDNAAPIGITTGPDGALWATDPGKNSIEKITPTGGITIYPLAGAASGPASIAAGPDGALWFTEVNNNKIGRIDTAGSIIEVSIPTPMSAPLGIGQGPDGAMWFTESTTTPERGKIGRIPIACFPDDHTLCLNNGRFAVRSTWTDFQGNTGNGNVVSGVSSSDSGLFWFFGPDNWEVLIKVLNGCGVNSHYWVFGAASTNVQYTIHVTDTRTGEVRTYTNPLGTSASAITDAAAFSSCP